MSDSPFPRAWPWLFPAAFAVHQTEEWTTGFVPWFARHLSANLTEPRFVSINVTGLAIVVLVALAVALAPRLWIALLPVAALVTLNGAAHLLATIGFGELSPGVVSGTLLFLPLGVTTFRRAASAASTATLAGSAALGVALQGFVTVVAIGP